MRWIYSCLSFDSFLSRSGITTLEFYVVIGVKAASVIAFGDVNLFFAAMVVVMRSFYVDLSISIAAVRISVTASNVDISMMPFKWLRT